MPPSRSKSLAGVRVALLEARMSNEMGELVSRHGGIPRFVPAVRETEIDCAGPVAEFLARLETQVPRVVVFLTGVGARTLFQEAERQAKLGFLVRALVGATVVCRGPKPVAAMKAYGLSPSLVAPSPYTSNEVLGVLESTDLQSVEVTLVHYGERNDALASGLHGRGARLHELCLYEWRLPEDIAPMQSLIAEVLAGGIDVVVFTSQIQGRHLLQVAGEMRQREALVNALNSKTVVAAVGPICCAALQESGVVPRIVPVNPKMGPLIANLAEYWANTLKPDSTSAPPL